MRPSAVIDWLRRYAFFLSVVAAITIILVSCVHTYWALDELPLVQRRIVGLEEQLFRLHRLQSTLTSATTRLRALALGGDQADQQMLSDAISQSGELVEALGNADGDGSLRPLLEDSRMHLSEVRELASDIGGIDPQERVELREQTLQLRTRLDGHIAEQRAELKRLRSLSERDRQRALTTLLGGHLLLLAVLAALYLARHSERRLRWQADLRTLEADERFALVVRGSADGMLLTDGAGRIQLANHALEAMFRCAEGQLQGTSIADLFATTIVDEWLTDRTGPEEQAPSRPRSVTAKRTDGTRFLADLTITPQIVRNHEFLAIAVRDVSERQESRIRLKQQEALLREIPEPLHILDAVGRIVYWNRGAERLYGFAAQEAIGQTADDLLQIVLPKDNRQNVHAVPYRGADRWTGELRARTKYGDWLSIERRKTRVREGNETLGEVVFDLDLGERKQLQLAERRRQRLESLGTLASGIAHDLNNLLTPILMSSRMLQRESANLNRQALAETIAASACRGADLIAQLLTFARGGDGQHETVRIADLLAEIASIVRHTLPPEITLDVDAAADLPSVCGDATEISQVVMNLAINARDSMESGGSLKIAGRPLRLDAETSYTSATLQPGRYVAITVSDTGTGIPLAIYDRIFDPFFTTKARGEGTGLGLSTSIGIVQSHAGAIDVQSTVGSGTNVTMVLPAEMEPAAPAESAPETNA